MRASADQITAEAMRVYDEFPLLRAYREYFGDDLTHADILGEGNAGLVVRARKHWMVAKIPRHAQARKKLAQEMDDHEYLFGIYRQGVLQGGIPATFKIPTIRHAYEYQGVYLMEEMKGHTAKRLYLIGRFGLGETLWEETLASMADYEIEEFILANHPIRKEELVNMLTDGMSILETIDPFLASDARKGLDFFKDNGIRHDDLHAGNIMVDTKWIVSIIDFDQVTIYRFDT